MDEKTTADWLHTKIVTLELEIELLERAAGIIVTDGVKRLIAALKKELGDLK